MTREEALTVVAGIRQGGDYREPAEQAALVLAHELEQSEADMRDLTDKLLFIGGAVLVVTLFIYVIGAL